MVNTQEWGPPLWRVLHTWAERLGRQTIPIMAADERRAWVNFLRTIEAVMPCAKCRLHFKAWRLKHPYERFLTAYDIRSEAREWLWSLHEEVNAEKGATGLALEDLPVLYGTRSTEAQQTDLGAVKAVFQRAAQGLQVPPTAVQAFKAAATSLGRFL